MSVEFVLSIGYRNSMMKVKPKINTMKKLLFMMFVLGIFSVGFVSCGEGGEEEGDTTESAEGEEEGGEEEAH